MPTSQQNIASDLVTDLKQYLTYLEKTYGYKITMHNIENVSSQNWPQLLAYNYHQCALCREIKSSFSAWKHCIDRQPKVRAKAEMGPYIGTCFAGVTEAVFPIWDIHFKCVGFLCISNFTQDRQMSMMRAQAVAIKYGLPQDKLNEAVEKLDENIPTLEELSAQIAPALTMLRMLFYFNNVTECKQEYRSAREKMYYEVLNYVNSSFRDVGFSLKNVCEQFNISYSYASHLFAEFNDLSFARYVRNIRVEAAKRYLEHTKLPIIFTSAECGFSDSNYFSSVFKSETGMTPKEWRARYRQNCEDIPYHLELLKRKQEVTKHGAQNDHP